jgi:hypothetical protein
MSATATIDHAQYSKRGFLLGVALFALGAGGHVVGTAAFGSLPAWETTLFFDVELLGVVIGLFSPVLFGTVLPLVE